jgi:hypothetical protein
LAKSPLVDSAQGATVLAIKHLADRAAQVAFADFGSFMLERTIRSLIDPDENPLQELRIAEKAEFRHPTHRLDCSVERVIGHGADRRCGKLAKLVDLEARLSPSYLH